MRVPARTVAVAAGLAGGLLAGCAQLDGIDRDLTGDWPPMPEVQGFVPEAGVCHETGHHPAGPLYAYHPVNCGTPHATETVHVGEFTGAVAERETPPPTGSAQWRAAYGQCGQAVREFLGEDFRHGMLWLGVTVPSEDGWAGGARWFRCELAEFDVHTGTFETRTAGSLAGALDAGSGLRLGCSRAVESEDGEFIEENDPVGCDQPHNSEFVGVWQAPDVPYLAQDDEDAASRVHRGCREQVAAYVDLPVDGNLQYRTGTIALWMGEQDWDNGNRGFRCYLWLNEREVSRSLADAGTSALPIQYE